MLTPPGNQNKSLNYMEARRKNQPKCTSHSSDEKKRLDAEADSTVAEKLWEGSLTLSSTVTVPSVAYFKSGEKLLTSKWHNSIRVKGKVHKEDFKKYIQDLSRSHSKGVTVISLCLKKGSSSSTLKSMIEVAARYTKDKKVGLADLPDKIRLYICPKSEALFRILAKSGFYKGESAIKKTENSMICCIIWPKGQTSNLYAKEPLRECGVPHKSLEEDSDSGFEVPTLRQLVQATIVPLSTTFTSIVHDNDVNVGNSNQCSQISMVDDQQVKMLRTEQREGNFNFQNTIISSPEILTGKNTISDDIDDLPQYDFMDSGNSSFSSLRKLLEEERVGSRVQITMGGGRNQNTLGSASFLPSKKNLFDDDDMPEWYPPERQDVMPKFPVLQFKNSSHCPPFQGFSVVGNLVLHR